LVGKRAINSVSKITRGFGVKVTRPVAKDFVLRLRSPLSAYIVKDMRLASMNPSLAFLYAAPLFEVITLAVIMLQFTVMRATAMFVGTMVGCFFTTMICSTLLNTEGAGLEYAMSLPLGARTIIDAKAFLAATTFIPVPLALLAIGLSKHVASNYILLIPFVELIAVCAACIGEIAFFVRPQGGKNALRQIRGFSMLAGSDITRLIQSLAIAFTLLFIPAGIYSLTYLQYFSYMASIYAMLLSAIVELLIVLVIMRRSTQ